MKLTAAIVHSYPNAHVTLNGYDIPIFKIDEIDFKHDEFTLMRVSDGDVFHEPISKCQLILTPLSKISDEDAVEVCGLVGWDASDKGKLLDCVLGSDNAIAFEFEMNIYRVKLSIEIIDYLRSKGYDLGHGNTTSLISAGSGLKIKV